MSKKEFGIGEYPTRYGSKGVVSHIAEKANGYPLVGYVVRPDGAAFPVKWSLKGCRLMGVKSTDDLVQEPATVWMNEYEDGFIGNYPTLKDATANATQNAIRTAVEFREVVK